MKPKLKKDGTRTYTVIGKSGAPAGYIQQVGPTKSRAWEVCLFSSPSTICFGFEAAKKEAINRAERY
jgi:hypothetical protein